MTVPPQDGWRADHDQPAGPSQPPPTVDGLKWLLIAIAVLLVVTISVGATLIVTRWGKGAATKAAFSDSTSDIASANDIGPVAMITDEPTCQTFVGINNSLGDLQAKGWGDQRSKLGRVSEWTTDQRATVEAVATATRNAADSTVPLIKRTPHRLVRELYEQFIVTGRAYADRIPKYVPADDAFASANVNASSAIIGICNTVTYGSVNRAVALRAVAPPSAVVPIGEPARPRFFISKSDWTCQQWIPRSDSFTSATADWEQLDSNIAGSQWTPERRAAEKAVQPLIAEYANQVEAAGRQSGNPVLEDFAIAAALYLRAYVSVGGSYISADSWLSYTGFRFSNLVESACQAAAS